MAIAAPTSSTPSPAVRPIDTQSHAFGRDVDGRGPNDGEAAASNLESLTFSSIVARPPATERNLNAGWLRFDTMDGGNVMPIHAELPGSSRRICMATSVASAVNPINEVRSAAHDARTITESIVIPATATIPKGVATVVQTTDVSMTDASMTDASMTDVRSNFDADTACIRTDAGCPEMVYAFQSLRGGIARVLNANSVFACLHEQSAHAVSIAVASAVTVARALNTAHWRSIDAAAEMAGLRSDTGNAEMVLPVFPPLESLAAFSTRIQAKAWLSEPRAKRPTAHEPFRSKNHQPKPQHADTACHVVLAGAVGAKLDAPVVAALALISARLGFRGTDTAIRRSLTNQTLTINPLTIHSLTAAKNRTTPQVASTIYEQAVILPLRFDDDRSLGQLVGNWVSSAAA